MYDELVVEAAAAAGCEPLNICQPVIREITNRVKLGESSCIILTGTAGDGKTYTARKVFESLGGNNEDWVNTDGILEYNYRGQKIEFVKDLSELERKTKNKLLPRLRASVFEKGDVTFIICSNYGHLLSFLSDKGRSVDGKRLYKLISDMHSCETKDLSDENLLYVNMSRRTDGVIIENIIDKIVTHKDWKKCKKCSYFKHQKNPCPIRLNLDIIKNKEKSSIQSRLKCMIEMAAADGKHIPTRQLIMLVVNIILGDRKNQNKPDNPNLLNCTRAKQRADEKDYKYTNPYANVFGENIDEQQRYMYNAYSALREFGVGYETSSKLDQMIISGKHDTSSDEIYGMAIFKPQRRDYRASQDKDTEAFCDAMIDQRRRLFFSTDQNIDENEDKSTFNPWKLSTFSYGDMYCYLMREKDSTDDIKKIRREIICGLNRIMSGLMTHTNDKLWIIEPRNEYTSGWKMPIAIKFAGHGHDGDARLSFKSPSGFEKAPQIIVTMPHCKRSIPFPLKPSLFEYLLRVANGTVPSTFSRECRIEIARFQLAINGLLEIEQREGILVNPQIVTLENGDLKSNRIDFFESAGDW